MDDLRVLITGATGGLGRELAIQLSAKGANLLLIDRASHELDELSDQICARNLKEPGVCALDFVKAGPDEFEALAEILEAEYGGLDVVIHCAASFQGLQPLAQVSPVQWLECMQVNLNAPWLATVTLLPLLKASGKGLVLFIHEEDKLTSSAYWGAYGVSKGALNCLGRMLADELESTDVEVLNVYPGPIRTALRARAYLSEDPQLIQSPALVARQIVAELMSSLTA